MVSFIYASFLFGVVARRCSSVVVAFVTISGIINFGSKMERNRVTILNLLVLLSSFATVFCRDDHPIVKVKQGQLQGFSSKSRGGRDYYAFEGVPYAKQPERFEVAEFPDKWEGIRQVTTPGNLCAQFDPFGNSVQESEDCLFMNVYSPKIDAKLPVMVYIHGGGFMFGNGDIFGGKYFMDEDVVLVTLNYRINVFGFISTEDTVLQGNLGMKDQVLALRWIQQNIAAFGGNPDKVTIFGMSAGGASVHYLLLSPLAQGLFHTAISQSGSVLNPWALQREPKANAHKLAKLLQCPVDTSEAIKKCLKTKSTKEIVNAYLRFSQWGQHPLYPFAPSIEHVPEAAKFKSAPVFLSDNPYKLVSQGKMPKDIPWFIGLTSLEGNFYVGSMTNEPGFPDEVNDRTAEIFSLVYGYDLTVPKGQQGAITDKIMKYYFDGRKALTTDDKDKTAISSLFGDRYFNFGVWKSIKILAKVAGAPKIYPYLFTTTDKDFTFGDVFFGKVGLLGPTHADCISFQFNITGLPNKRGDALKVSEHFIKLWASIAKNGKPTGTWGKQKEWKPVSTPDSMKWYQIDVDTAEIDLPFEANMKFWDELPLNELEREKSRDEL